MLSLITPTSGRPEAFSLLEQWVAAQDYDDPFEWIVATDDPLPYAFTQRQHVLTVPPSPGVHPLGSHVFTALAHCHYPKILILEDDDYYSPQYLRVMDDLLDDAELVGTVPAWYYHVGTNRYKRNTNSRHASLAQTGVTGAAIAALRDACRGESPFVDLRLWRGYPDQGKRLAPNPLIHVSIKGMPGKAGIGVGHRPDMGSYDEDLEIFRQLKLPEVYLKYSTTHRGRAADRTATHRNAGLIAPSGYTAAGKEAYKGRGERKPWDYRVTAVIPHLNTPAPLLWAIRTLQEQSIPPYVLVIDTGSNPDVLEEIEGYRSESVEIHYLRCHGWPHSSEPVAAALDTAHALCRTEYIYHTHSDCFIRRHDWIEWLLSQCGPDRPVVGYQMSDRSWVTDQWKWMVSHTATILHWPTLRAAGVSWSMTRNVHQSGKAGKGWPDTETGFNWCLRNANIVPQLIAPEYNYVRQTDENIDHVRSFGSYAIYGVNSTEERRNKDKWMNLAIEDARRNVRLWQQQPAPRGREATQREAGTTVGALR